MTKIRMMEMIKTRMEIVISEAFISEAFITTTPNLLEVFQPLIG